VVALSQDTLARCAGRLPVPRYDRREAVAGVVHLGVGGFHRAHQAMYQDRLMNAGMALDWAICGVGVLPADRSMQAVLTAQDCLYTLVLKHPDGRQDARVIGAITEYRLAPGDAEAVVERMADPAIRIVSLTITEGGYHVDAETGALDADHPDLALELERGGPPRSAHGLIVEALRRRRERGVPPFTVMSCDNLQGNGSVARAAFTGFAAVRDPGLAEWIGEAVSFPNAMVDRITPTTRERDCEELERRFGVQDGWPVVAEPFVQWVLEDRFTAGRPPYEHAGVQLVADVAPYELMKMRLLNGSHQAMAYFGRLAGMGSVHEAATDPLVGAFLRAFMAAEVAPTLRPVPGLDVDEYQRTLLDRFSNPHVGDTLERICAWTSDRIPKFVLPVIRERLAAGQEVRRGAAVIATWARYAEGTDDAGRDLDVVDARRDALIARARRWEADPLAFLRVRELFGDLADDPRFTTPYAETLTSLHERGARATLPALA
jgi:mannitol 2-dehydrogenase